jgi:deoxyhypusine synthase
MKPRRLDLRRIKTYPLTTRASKVALQALATPPRRGMRMGQFLAGLPDILAAADLRRAATTLAARHHAGKRIALGMGAHPIKVGLSPLIIDLMQRGVLSAVAMNGAAIIHDFELAYAGATSEDVAAHLADGRFGMAEETGRFLNDAIKSARTDEGLGAAVGRRIVQARLPHRRFSILAAGHRLGIPVTVHVAIGTDIIHMHPSADGAAIGAGSLRDFHLLAAVVARMNGGAFINLGSAVIIPEVFLKALNLARNVGRRVGKLLTIDMDFIRHYRPQMNVVTRPTAGGGTGYHFTGHHEIMFPLLCAAVLEELK